MFVSCCEQTPQNKCFVWDWKKKIGGSAYPQGSPLLHDWQLINQGLIVKTIFVCFCLVMNESFFFQKPFQTSEERNDILYAMYNRLYSEDQLGWWTKMAAGYESSFLGLNQPESFSTCNDNFFCFYVSSANAFYWSTWKFGCHIKDT